MKKLFKKIVSLFYTPAVIENDKRHKLEFIRGLVFINKQEIETTSSFCNYLSGIFSDNKVDHILFSQEIGVVKNQIFIYKSIVQYYKTFVNYKVYNSILDKIQEFKLCKVELLNIFGCIPETICVELILKKP